MDWRPLDDKIQKEVSEIERKESIVRWLNHFAQFITFLYSYILIFIFQWSFGWKGYW